MIQCMKYVTQKDDEEITTIRVKKRVRHKLGYCVNGNETLEEGFERILDKELVQK